MNPIYWEWSPEGVIDFPIKVKGNFTYIRSAEFGGRAEKDFKHWSDWSSGNNTNWLPDWSSGNNTNHGFMDLIWIHFPLWSPNGWQLYSMVKIREKALKSSIQWVHTHNNNRKNPNKNAPKNRSKKTPQPQKPNQSSIHPPNQNPPKTHQQKQKNAFST